MLYPSAIFSHEHRGDTNIGKMQKFARYIPFVPKISVFKTVTFLPKLSSFIVHGLSGYLQPGSYLTAEKPILTVTAMVKILSGNNKKVIPIPCLKNILAVIASLFHVIGGFGRIDLKLTPNRVVKLFSDTSYDGGDLVIDRLTYNSHSSLSLPGILQNFSEIE